MHNSLIYPLRSGATSPGQGQSAVVPKSDVEKLHDYLIERNGEGVKKVLLLNGYTQVTTKEQMQLSILSFIKKQGAKAIEQLLCEHPDYELIVADYLAKNPIQKKKDKKADLTGANAQACSSFKQIAIPTLQVDFNSMVNLLMFLVCVWLVLKIFKS